MHCVHRKSCGLSSGNVGFDLDDPMDQTQMDNLCYILKCSRWSTGVQSTHLYLKSYAGFLTVMLDLTLTTGS